MNESLLDVGKKYSDEKQFERAIEQFKEAIRLEPASSQAHFELGKVYFVQKQYELAKSEFAQAIASDPGNVYAHLLLGKACRIGGEHEKAAEELEVVYRTGYPDENIGQELFEIYRELNSFDKAYYYLEKARENDNRYAAESYEKDLLHLHRRQIRAIDDLSFEGNYPAVIREARKALDRPHTDNLMVRNTFLNQAEAAQKKVVLESRPRSLTFTVTNKCNLACVMCETRKTPWVMPDRAKEEIIKTFLPYVERVMWQGGEFFLYKGFEELLDATAQYPIRQLVVTNGTLLNEHIAEKLVRYNVELSVSIDGCTKEAYEYVRPGAQFEKVLENVELVNRLREKYNPSMLTRLNVVVMRVNYKQIEDFVDFAHRLKFSKLYLNSTGYDFKNLQQNLFYYNHDDEAMAYINSVRDRIAQKAKDYGLILENWLPTEKFFNDMGGNEKPVERSKDQVALQEPQKVENTAGNGPLFCHAPWQRMYLDCGGKVRPDCLCSTNNYVGDLNQSTFEEIWNCEKMVQFRERIIAGKCQGFCNNDCLYGRAPAKNFKFI